MATLVNPYRFASTPAPGHDALVLAKSPTGFWKLNEPSGTAAADSTPDAAKDGVAGAAVTMGGSTTAAGDPCPTFAGTASTGQVTIPDHADFSTHAGASGLWSCTGWFRSTSFGGVSRTLFWKSNASFYEWLINCNTSGVIRAQMFTSAAGIVADTVGPTLSTSTWYHIALTYDRAAATMRLYVNGVNTTTDASMSGVTSDTATSVMIGGRGDTAGDRWVGQIARVATYPSVLSGAEIAAMHTAGI